MITYYTPSFYDDFHCLAGDCPDTCCQQWDIDIDPETLSLYENLPGPLGDKIRSNLHSGEDGPVITLRDGACPMHRSDGLCEIQAQLGEQALSRVCREFPRLRHDYGDFVELGLELSCPEAARILLTAPSAPALVTEVQGEGSADYDREAMEVLKATRLEALKLLDDPERPLSEILALLFFYGCHAQQLLDGEEPEPFSPEAALETASILGQTSDFQEAASFFRTLDVLTEAWKQLLSQASPAPLSPLCRNLARYLVGRYWLQAVSDYDLYCRVKFILISCLLVNSLPGDFIDNAHLFSKEIENDCDNVDTLLDAAYESPLFTDARILGWLRESFQNAPV